jgi:hypothetical protein
MMGGGKKGKKNKKMTLNNIEGVSWQLKSF